MEQRGGRSMLQHFQYKSLFANTEIPGWHISFYYKKQKHHAIYHQSGTIEWKENEPSEEAKPQLQAQIHELMLFHVYDK
jgi:hypothetical protein